MIKTIFLTILTTLILIQPLKSQWLDKQTLNATVLLEKVEKDGFPPYGTGFLYYNYENTPDNIVVTCAHLVKGKKIISVRVNPDTSLINILTEQEKKGTLIQNVLIEENSIRFIVDLTKTPVFIHPTLDIAAFTFKIPALYSNGEQLKLANFLFIPKSIVKHRNEISLGDEAYFIGFPLGYGAFKYVEPIVRSGSVAWMPKDESVFLLDAFSYGGNSGSPIFQKNIVGTKPGDLSWSGTKLMGMVVGHQSIKLENMLNQPNPDELKFEVTDVDLNIGLARCVYTDDIDFVIENLKKKLK